MLGTPSAISTRATVAAGPLASLAASLGADLDRLLPDENVFVPPEKARMTRAGGRCERDGTFLEFDPTSPRRHRCPGCGNTFAGEDHYRWWIMGYQLWLAERAVHAAVLWRVAGERRHHALAAAILDRLAEQYLSYPNQDNVLGPTRVFFSTYLESIWLLQVAVATSLLEPDGRTALGARVRDRIVEPSSALIASFNEGLSNRQVWNAAAGGASGVLLDRPAMVHNALDGPGGLSSFLRDGLLPDGTWYEGENYHLFAHRGLWYLVMLATGAGLGVDARALARFDEGFRTPLRTALPDFTFPARRDAQYGASLRQWRVAESLEIGLARNAGSLELARGLARMYEDAPPGDPARWRSTAEAERNVPGVRLTRADLGWKALWFALPEIPVVEDGASDSVLMEGQGLGILRRDGGRTYVALDYGHSGGSHGHPDRLTLWLVARDQRVFEDVGTGSYVERTLHWYRSTLAHNAPLVDGRSQQRVNGVLRAWDEHGAWGWIDAEAEVSPGVIVRRSVVVADRYLIDRVEWNGDRDVTVDLPMHVVAELDGARWVSAALPGRAGLEDGFEFLSQVESAGTLSPARLMAPDIRGVVQVDVPHEWWRAVAPGPPREPPRRFLLVRGRGQRGNITAVWSWAGAAAVAFEPDGALRITAGSNTWMHKSTGDTWQVHDDLGNTTTLDGRRDRKPPAASSRRRGQAAPRAVPIAPWIGISAGDRTASESTLRFELGESHYCRTESSWTEAGSPTATVCISASATELLVEVTVMGRPPNFAPPQPENPLDNEHPDTNSDGVQLHLATQSPTARYASWLMVPEPGSTAVRCSGRDDAATIPLEASWRLTSDGWQVLARVSRAALGSHPALAMDVIVNEMPPGRERRRGQLVMSGRGSGWAYLRGDRQDREALIPMVIRDA